MVILYCHLIFICTVVLGDELQLVNGNITYNTDMMKDGTFSDRPCQINGNGGEQVVGGIFEFL